MTKIFLFFVVALVALLGSTNARCKQKEYKRLLPIYKNCLKKGFIQSILGCESGKKAKANKKVLRTCRKSAVVVKACGFTCKGTDGGWSDFGEWSDCSAECGGGTQTRSRSCDNPAPDGGADCKGDKEETRKCNEDLCSVPVDGGWSAFGDYSDCSAACGGGTQSRSRSCDNPAPEHGGADCEGDESESQDCNVDPCPGIKVEYEISVDVDSGWYDGTDDMQFVKIKGTDGETEEFQCVGDFTRKSHPTCTVTSDAAIGAYRCVIWRTGGSNGWVFTEMRMTIDGVKQKTYDNFNDISLDNGETKEFCPPVPGVAYRITVEIEHGLYDGTSDMQFVKIRGTKGETDERQCQTRFKYGTDATCTVQDPADIGDYRCVIWRTGGSNGWIFEKLEMSIDGVVQHTYENLGNIKLDNSETKEFCLKHPEKVEYKITVEIEHGLYDGTKDPQFVTIMGTKGETEELQCVAKFKYGGNPTCYVYSDADIGDYRCVSWRTGGTNGWVFDTMAMAIDGVQKRTFVNSFDVSLDHGETEKFCIDTDKL